MDESKPVVVIDLPRGDIYKLEGEVRVNITVSDPDGVSSYSWGVFAQNGSPLGLGGNVGCGNSGQCNSSEEFEAKLTGQFFIGVDALDAKGNTVREVKQIYVN